MAAKNKIQPEERIPTFPRREVYFSEKELEAHGFPAEVSKAFLRTADDTNCVVMSRAPGGAGTELIRHGYDLKGFLIKAKSCNWGPMAGFLCQIPALNKYGSKKIAYNYKNHKKYLEYRKKHNILDTPAYIPLKITKKRKDQILKPENGFLEEGFFEKQGEDRVIGLAFARDRSVVVEFLMVRSKKSGKTPELWSLYHGNILYKAILANKKKYISLFNVLQHMDGEIDRKKMPAFFKEPVEGVTVENHKVDPNLSGGLEDANPKDEKAKQEPTGKEPEGLVEAHVKNVLKWQAQNLGEDYTAIAFSDVEKKYFTKALIDKFKIRRSDNFSKFYPICGAQNPFPPYRFRAMKNEEKNDGKRTAYDAAKKSYDGENSYKNAVTGDYDLFAVWPVKPPVGWEMLTRLAEQQIAWAVRLEKWKTGVKSFEGKDGEFSQRASFFLDRAGKAFSLESRASPDVFVEVIAGFDEIDVWESPELGNINDATALVASSLNDTVSIAAERCGGRGPSRGRVAPNMAFHSDEGGRPGIDEVDYPFAVYLPKSLFERLTKDVKDSKALNKTQKKAFAPKSRMLLIDKPRHDDFLDLACMLREKCYLLFNHVWLMQMFVLLCDEKTLKEPGIDTQGELDPQKPEPDKLKKLDEDRKNYFKDRLVERGNVDRDRIKARLTELFIGSQLRTKHKDSKVRKKEQDAADASLANLAGAFYEIAAKDLGGKMGTVERMMNRLRAAMIQIPERGEGAKILKPKGGK